MLLALILYVFLVILGNPISSNLRKCEEARPFLETLYPDRPVLPADSSSAPVAVVFSLIRSGDDDAARKAIDFAKRYRLGLASPYVVERLESENGDLRNAARTFLVSIAGQDYGATAEPWRAWWRDPPRKVLGLVTVGQHTLELASPFLLILTSFITWGVRRLWKGGPPLSADFFWDVFVAAWFMAFIVASYRLVGGSETCTFGSETITYHVEINRVVGLEDSRAGDVGLGLLLVALYVVVPAAFLGFIKLFEIRQRRKAIKEI